MPIPRSSLPALLGPTAVPAAAAALPDSVPVVVAGASFAGLAVARVLGASALVVDRMPLGAGQTSACGAPVWVVEHQGAERAILQHQDHLVISVEGRREAVWPLPQPFCTFDYRAYCDLAFAGSGAAFAQASVRAIDHPRSLSGREGAVVRTNLGDIRARFVVDATGPRTIVQPTGRRRGRVAFGLETEVDAAAARRAVRDSTGLSFHFVPEVRDGYAWVFPAGDVCRIGVLSYFGRTKLRSALRSFLQRFGMAEGPVHGGFLATGLADPVEGPIFGAGDAVGHCLPLTGEGIRTAILAGDACGRLLRGVLDGMWGADEAAAGYRAHVAAERRRYRALLWGNIAALAMPRGLLGWVLQRFSYPAALRLFYRNYMSIFSAEPLRAIPIGSATEG